MHPLAADLVARGWAVANIEYRRVGNGGGWTTTLQDIGVAIQRAKAARPQWCSTGPVISIGHSAGGQLALLTADYADAVVGLAPVTDVQRVDAEGLADNAALGFMGAHYADMPGAYDAASPIVQLPLERPLLIVHGDVDDRVPEAHSASFAKAAAVAGDAIDYRVFSGLSHMDQIDPQAQHWADCVAWMASVPALR
ncbi:alpha/beta hydrolase family protein [Arthrobacter sp. TMN-49]